MMNQTHFSQAARALRRGAFAAAVAIPAMFAANAAVAQQQYTNAVVQRELANCKANPPTTGAGRAVCENYEKMAAARAESASAKAATAAANAKISKVEDIDSCVTKIAIRPDLILKLTPNASNCFDLLKQLKS